LAAGGPRGSAHGSELPLHAQSARLDKIEEELKQTARFLLTEIRAVRQETAPQLMDLRTELGAVRAIASRPDAGAASAVAATAATLAPPARAQQSPRGPSITEMLAGEEARLGVNPIVTFKKQLLNTIEKLV
jgi:hypothetical protein